MSQCTTFGLVKPNPLLTLNEAAPSTYLVGLSYDAPRDEDGYFDFKRRTTLPQLAREIQTILDHGHSHPTFPPEARIRLLFVWDLEAVDDGDCYAAVMQHLKPREEHHVE